MKKKWIYIVFLLGLKRDEKSGRKLMSQDKRHWKWKIKKAIVKCESSKAGLPEVIGTIAVRFHYLIDFSKQKGPNGCVLWKEDTLKRTKALIVPRGEYTRTRHMEHDPATTRISCQLKISISSSAPNIQNHHSIALSASYTNYRCFFEQISLLISNFFFI